MTTQYTPTLKLALPVTGELSGTWGDIVNDNITSMIEQAIAGLATINTWTGNAHTLTTANGTTSESRCAMLVAADGAGLSAAGEIICPAAAKLYVLNNGSSYAITLKTSAGTGVAVAAGETAFLFCDGTNVNSCVTTIVNGHITGNLTVDGNATINGNTTLGNATSDTVTVTARVASNVLPSADNTYDLGASANAWKDLYVDGTATMALVAISGGTINGVSIGATTPATFLAVDNLSLNGNTLASTDTNGNIVIAPNGTGDVQLDADTVRVGDSGAAVSVTSNGAGALTVTTGGAADLTLSTNSGTDSGTVVIANGVNGNITLTPNGTGDVILSADRVQIGDSNTDTTLTTNGTGSLNLTTNNGTNSGTIQIAQGANGNITLTPNGTGSVSVPKLVWSNGTATRVPYLTTGGQFTDSANLTFNGTDLTVSGAVNAGTINATTLDLTNLEVTNIKAKDGTAAITIADSTGAVTVSSAFSTQGNTTLGDASTDTVTVNGNMGIGGSSGSSTGLWIRNSALSGTTQRGLLNYVVGTSAATAAINGIEALVSTEAASYTVTNLRGFLASDATKGAGSTITNQFGFQAADQTQGTNNYGFVSGVSSGTNKWNFYASGTAANYFAGDVGVGNTSITDFSGRVLAVHAASGSAARIKLTTATSGTASTDGGGIVYDTSNVLQLINRESDGVISFATNATEAGRFASTGYFGIGTTSISSALTVRTTHSAPSATSYPGAFLIHDEANSVAPHLNAGVAYDGGGNYSWIQSCSSGGSYPLILQGAGGKVGIGTKLPGTLLVVGAAQTVPDTGAYMQLSGGLEICATVAQDYRAQFETDSTTLYLSSNSYYAGGWNVYDANKAPANITLTSDNGDSYIAFRTSASNSGYPSEAARINKSGYLIVGGTSTYSASGGGISVVTVEKSQANRTNLVVTNQTNNASAGAALVLAAYGADWILESGATLKSSNALTFRYGATERARFSSGGAFIVGGTSAANSAVITATKGGGVMGMSAYTGSNNTTVSTIASATGSGGGLIIVSGVSFGSGQSFSRLYLAGVKVAGGAASVFTTAISSVGEAGVSFTFADSGGYVTATAAGLPNGTWTVMWINT